MAKKYTQTEIREFDDAKAKFLADFSKVLNNPKKELFENGTFQASKFSQLLNTFVDIYLKGKLKGKIDDAKFPNVSVQKLTTLPAGSKNSLSSAGNYNSKFNFIEINIERFSIKSNTILRASILNTIEMTCHEFQHFVQRLYSEEKVQDSKVVQGPKFNVEEFEENNKTMIELSSEQIELAKSMLGENPEAIKEDYLYGNKKNNLIQLAEAMNSPAYKAGHKASNKSIFNRGGKKPLYAAHYFLRPYEIDARETSLTHYDEFAADFESFNNGKGNSKLAKLVGWAHKKINKHERNMQPQKAIEIFMQEAEKFITPEAIIAFFNDDKHKIPREQKEVIAIHAVIELLSNQPQEKQEDFLNKLQSVFGEEIINDINNSVKKRVSQVSKQQISETGYYDHQQQTEKQSSISKQSAKSIEQENANNHTTEEQQLGEF